MPRLHAEYYDPSDSDSHPAQHGRRIFLHRVQVVEPDVLATLRDDVLPACRDAWEQAEPFVQTQFFLRGWNALARIPNEMRPPQLPALVGALEEWAKGWHLTDPWILDCALSTMRWWTEHPETLAAPLYWYAPWGTGAPAPPPLILHWLPMTMTWADFETYALQELRRYRDDVEILARKYGWEPAPEKRAAHGKTDAGEHFEWLARWQVQGWDHGRIVDHYRVGAGRQNAFGDETTVQKALKKTADLIGLTPRP